MAVQKNEDAVSLPGPRNATVLPDRPALTAAVPLSVEGLSNKELVSHIIDNAVLLAKKEVELAKTELRKDLKAEVGMVKGLGIAGACALFTVQMLLVAAALALGNVIAGWAAALIVAGAVLAVGGVAGFVGWKKRVTNPLEATRRTLKEDAQWAKERLA